MVAPRNTIAPTRRTGISVYAYYLLVGLAGCAVLAALVAGAPPLDGRAVLAYALISVGVKSLGFRVARNVTHSLVGVVDLAALYTLGVPGAAVVALASSAVCQATRGERDAGWRSAQRWGPVVFAGGLNVLKIVVAGWAYRVTGGTTPLATITWPLLLPVICASLSWFAVDHVAWSLAISFAEGRSGAIRFVRGIMPYSLLVELLPLPVAAIIATAQQVSSPLFLLVALTTLGVGYVLQTLMVSLSQERRHVRELSTISALGHDLLNARLDVEAVCGLVMGSCAALVDATTSALWLDGERPGSGVTYVMLGGRPPEPVEHGPPGGILDAVARSRRSMLVADFAEGELGALPYGPPARSGLFVPIARGEDLLGILALQSPRPRAFGRSDLQAVELVAAQAAMGLQTARLYQAERRRAAQLLAIAEVTRKVAAIQGLAELFRDTVRLVADTFDYYHVGVFTIEPGESRVAFRAASSAHIEERGLDVPWGAGIVGTAAAEACTVVANDVLADERFLPDAALPETRAEMAVPLIVEDRIVGVLDVQSNLRDAFGEGDRFVLETLAAQIAVAVEDSRLYQSQQEQAWVSTALQQVAEAVVRVTRPEDVLGSVARLTTMLVGVDRCLVFVWSEDDQAYSAAVSVGWTRDRSAALADATFPPDAVPLLARIRREGQIVVARSEDLLRYMPPPVTTEPARGLLVGLPLRVKGEIVGALLVEALGVEGPLEEHRMTILAGIANHAALGLENARLYISQREEAWVSTALLQVANSITASVDLADTVATVARLVPMLVGVDWSAVVLCDEEAVRIHSAHGLPTECLAHLLGDGDGHAAASPIRRIMERGEPLIVSDPVAAGYLSAADDGDDVARGAMAAFPMRARARSLGVLLAGQHERRAFSGRNVAILSGIASQAALAVEAAQLYARTLQQQRLEREIELAREIQVTFLPECCPEIPGWQLAVEWRAARGAAGDFYDFIQLDDRHLGLVIADVSDKGVAAALYMALSRTVLRAAALDATGPADTLERANRVLLDESRSGMFVSIFYGVLDCETGRLSYARAGHNPPYVLRTARSALDSLCPPGTVLGVTETPDIAQDQTELAPGDVLVMYTDGVTDALNWDDEAFGEERLERLLTGSDARCADDVVCLLDEAVQAFAGSREQFDDFTLLVVRREGE